jgi:hypothetical protein
MESSKKQDFVLPFNVLKENDQSMELLRDDILANILGRLSPCSLAASRYVCKDWSVV